MGFLLRKLLRFLVVISAQYINLDFFSIADEIAQETRRS
jgi:hypothetical protein